MPAKRALFAAMTLVLAVAVPVRGATLPTIEQIDIYPMGWGSNPGPLVPFADRVFFYANDNVYGSELWRTDGAPDVNHVGSELACNVRSDSSGMEGSNPTNLIVLGDWLYFQASDGTNGYELYRTNGDIDGCSILAINPGGDASISNPAVAGDQLWFSADDGSHGAEPWMTDNSSPALVENINPTGSSDPGGFTKLGSYVYFAADDGAHGREVWRSDGTTATLFWDVNDGAASSNPRDFIAVGNTLYFTVDTATQGAELAQIAVDGYHGVVDIVSGVDGSGPANYTNFNGRLYFTAYTPESGTEIWRFTSDGLVMNRVTDINVGGSGSYPQGLASFGDWLYFQADDGSHGYELWRTNGTTTEMVKDINEGSNSGYPYGMTSHLGVLYFQAYSGTLWTIYQTTGSAASTVEAVQLIGTNPAAGCECYKPIVFLGDRLFTYLYNDVYGWEPAFFDPLLPSTNRDGSSTPLILVFGAALTAAAALTLRRVTRVPSVKTWHQ